MHPFEFYLKLGFEHIANLNGYDHILFLVALCAVYQIKQWRKILILVTAFTIGHSITLFLVSLNIFSIPSSIIKLLIPITIIITCFQNVIEKIDMKAKLGPFKKSDKPFRIIDAYIDANLLYVQIEYKAPCSGNDSFEFIGGPLYLDEQNRKARDAHLYILSSSETCSIINETKIIDLRPLTSVEQRDAEVVLNIGGWRTKMTYVYIPQ